jgi:hypothetical protein
MTWMIWPEFGANKRLTLSTKLWPGSVPWMGTRGNAQAFAGYIGLFGILKMP